MNIVFKPGCGFTQFPPVTLVHSINVAILRIQIADLQHEWEEATGGKLDQVTINLSLLFDDINLIISKLEVGK
jgi:hypothetical protein